MKMLCRSPVARPAGRLPRVALTDTTDGTENQCVTARSTRKSTGASRSVRLGETRVAPPPQVTNRSNTDGSKVRSNVCEVRHPGPIPNRAMLRATYDARPRWVIGTPLGRPVDPEVNST